MIRPISGVLTNIFAGSIVDRTNKRKLMIILDIFRAALLVLLLFYPNLIMIYIVTFIVQMASHLFGNFSFAYITKLIPETQRPRFNSLNSLLGAGAFIIGPAIAGVLFIIGTPQFAILINIIILFISGIISCFLPNVDSHLEANHISSPSKWQIMKDDVIQTINYYRVNNYIMYLCILFSGLTVVLATAVDSLEASFATIVLLLSESEYGFLVSIAGIGMGAGALINVLIVNRIKPTALLNIGILGNAIGYCIYAFSYNFIFASIGFFVLSFFLAFANSSFMTIYQKQIKVEIIGRVGAFNGLLESLFILILTGTFGYLAKKYDIRLCVIIGSLFMFILAIGIYILNKKQANKY